MNQFVAALAIVVMSGQDPDLMLVEQRRFGTTDGPAALTRINDVLQAPDGIIYVAQPQEGIIKVFDTNGALRGSIGRRGSGPGEFRGIDRLGWFRDSLLVYDGSSQRLTLVPASGGDVRTVGLVPQEFTRPWHSAAPIGLMSNGSAIVLPPGLLERGEAETSTPLMHFDPSLTSRLPDLAHLKGTGINYRIRIGNAVVSGQHPVPRGTLWAIHPWSSGLVVYDNVSSDGPGHASIRVRRIAGNGAIVFDKYFRFNSVRILDNVADSIINAIASSWHRKLVQIGRPIDESTIRSDVRAGLQLPEYWPAADRLLHGSDGSIWFRRQGIVSGVHIWEIIGPDGRLRGQLRIPGTITLHQVSMTVVLASRLGSHDVPIVILYRLQS